MAQDRRCNGIQASVAWPNDLLQPRYQMLHVESSFLEELYDVVVNRLRVCGNQMAVDSQKNIDHGKRDPLVAIDEWMVLNEAFHERCSFVNEGVVVTGLRSMKS